MIPVTKENGNDDELRPKDNQLVILLRRIDPQLIERASEIAQSLGVELEALFSRRREQPGCLARHTFWTYLYDGMGWSYPRIARIWGVDHTTVMSGVKRARAAYELAPSPAAEGDTLHSTSSIRNDGEEKP